MCVSACVTFDERRAHTIDRLRINLLDSLLIASMKSYVFTFPRGQSFTFAMLVIFCVVNHVHCLQLTAPSRSDPFLVRCSSYVKLLDSQSRFPGGKPSSL